MAENPNFSLDRESVEAVLNLTQGESVVLMPWAINQAALERFAAPVFSHEDQYTPDATPHAVAQHRDARRSG